MKRIQISLLLLMIMISLAACSSNVDISFSDSNTETIVEKSTELPEEKPEPEPEPNFDIGYWISYAKSTATAKGLVLDSAAVDCWDNPIDAGASCIYLERDINSRLSRYAADEDITDVWIWYKCIGTNRYLIYIGYA